MHNVTFICTNADRVAAKALAVASGDGPGTFSVPLALTAGVTNPALATHWGYTGTLPDAISDALAASTAPVLSLAQNEETSFDAIIAARSPRLYRI